MAPAFVGALVGAATGAVGDTDGGTVVAGTGAEEPPEKKRGPPDIVLVVPNTVPNLPEAA